MPLSSISCAEPMTPPDTITSPPARSWLMTPSRDTSTPTARPLPSKSTRVTRAPVSTVSSGWSSTGSMKAVHAVARFPPRMLRCANPAPSISAPLQSSLYGSPYSVHASTNATLTGLGSWLRVTGSGPPAPWYCDSPSSKSSERLKYGSTSSYDQPAAPLYAQLS